MNYYIDIGADGQDLMNHMVDQDFDYLMNLINHKAI